MSLRNFVRLAALSCALMFFGNSAQAVTVPITPGGSAILLDGNTYYDNGGLGAGSGPFELIYNFKALYTIETASNAQANFNKSSKIKDFVLTWYDSANNALGFVTETDGSGLNTNAILLLTLAAGDYVLKLTGTGVGLGAYNLTVDVTAVPIPPALVLFGTALAGIGFLSRRRRHQGMNEIAS